MGITKCRCPAYRKLALAGLIVLQVVGVSRLVPAQKLADAVAPVPSQTAATDQPGKLPRVSLDGTYFTRDGKRFLPLGAHWVPAKAAMEWPTEWDPKDIEADFAKMHELGYSIVRFDMLWAWFEPRPGDYNPEAFAQLDYLVSLAHKYQIYLHPSLFIGGEVGEAYWDVPWRHGRHPHADPEMLRLQGNLAAEFGRRYVNENAIIAWDLTDEPPFWIVEDQTTDAMAINWTHLIVDGIRHYDKLHPIVVGTSGQELGHGPFRSDNIAPFVDFFSVHPFTLYAPELFPDPLLSARGTYGAAFEIALSNGAGHPVMIHEMGASTAQFSPERVAAYDRAQMYSGLGAGSIGVDLWCYTDASPEQFHKVPYLRTPQETGWGMTTWDRQDKPLAREFKKFAQIAGHLDLSGLSPAAAEAGIIIPGEWAKPHGDFSRFGLTGPAVIPYVSMNDGDAMPGRQPSASSANDWLMGSALTSFVLARRAGLKADFPREYDDWSKRPMLLLPSPLTSTGDAFLVHVHSDFYAKAKKYVEQGGVLYASVASDGAIPEMASLFGARLVDRAPSSEVTLKFVEPFGDFKPGDTLHYSVPTSSIESWGSLVEVSSGRVIAVDEDGHPALVTHSLGSGKTLLSAYPLEHYLASVPSVFDQPENTHRVYQAFRDWAGIQPVFRTDRTAVEVSALSGESRGYLILVNHGATSQNVTVFSSRALRTLSRLGPDSAAALSGGKSGWKIAIEPYDGAILEWKQ
ncbi:MAG TPA: beta-galactosidase [Terriglobales bacterium]|nr:beta-galactosidase [Terriglobales bacterium]